MSKDKDDQTKGKKGAPSDMDALDTFPLSIVPLTSTSLKSAKLIKNTRMETTVELHNDPISGSYQIFPEAIAETFKGAEKDQELIVKLSLLNSYDVFSLRNSIKKLGLELQDPGVLTLSDTMRTTLNSYALHFTRPLLENIFGSNNGNNTQDLQQLLRDPDVARVRENLAVMTRKTGIPMTDIPKFIEDYNDVFLSLSYYRHNFETLSEAIVRILLWIDELKHHRDITSTPQTLTSCKRTEEALKFLSTSLRERLGRLQYSFETFWKDINQESFTNLRQQIEDNHASMGAVLCGLIVKLRNWEKTFPDNSVGGPVTRAKFVVTELEPGLERLKTLENVARMRLGLIPIKG